jgi:hypothetical protein
MTLAGVPGEPTRPPGEFHHAHIMLKGRVRRREKDEKSQLQICHPFTAERSHYKRRLVLCRRRLISLSGVGTYTKLNLIRSNKRAALAAGGKGFAAFSARLSHTPARSKFQSRNSKITAGTADERREEK